MTAGGAGAALAGAAPDDTGVVRLDEDEHLVVPPLSAEDVPAEAKTLKEEPAVALPFAPIRCGPAAPVGGGAGTCWEQIYPSTG